MTAGLATCAAAWLLMQPAWGMGLAASKVPDPMTARLRTVRTCDVRPGDLGLGPDAYGRV
ncbi:Protein of uncharacterised function (DUF2938) [Dermatophilus congolensis]|uniref:Protein of uncharacterized function (DUF2938) n=2 Tax=Dermatophilus congolensis TaxID=1863 RepID=A0AA46GZR7_9MICO|nr:Protein of uncharacterised function (DUF2938) [Dermatophilus congolensis]